MSHYPQLEVNLHRFEMARSSHWCGSRFTSVMSDGNHGTGFLEWNQKSKSHFSFLVGVM